MTPVEFLALSRQDEAAGDGRVYRACVESAGSEAFLAFHTANGHYECPAYNQLVFISGDEPGWTAIRLIFLKLSIVVHGRQLLPVSEAIRGRRAAHLYEFDSGMYDPLELEQPVITRLEFEIGQGGTN